MPNCNVAELDIVIPNSRYEILKLSLLPKYKNDRDGCTEAKSGFVRQTIKRALKQ